MLHHSQNIMTTQRRQEGYHELLICTQWWCTYVKLLKMGKEIHTSHVAGRLPYPPKYGTKLGVNFLKLFTDMKAKLASKKDFH